MLELGQKVVVISDKGMAYAGFITARATGAGNAAAYKVAAEGAGLGQTGQWHKEADVFVQEQVDEDGASLPDILALPQVDIPAQPKVDILAQPQAEVLTPPEPPASYAQQELTAPPAWPRPEPPAEPPSAQNSWADSFKTLRR